MEKENKNEDKKDKLVLSREQLNQLVKQASISSNLTLLSELSKIIAANLEINDSFKNFVDLKFWWKLVLNF